MEFVYLKVHSVNYLVHQGKGHLYSELSKHRCVSLLSSMERCWLLEEMGKQECCLHPLRQCVRDCVEVMLGLFISKRWNGGHFYFSPYDILKWRKLAKSTLWGTQPPQVLTVKAIEGPALGKKILWATSVLANWGYE